MKRIGFALLTFLLFVSMISQAQPKLTIDLNNKGIAISPVHYGIFFEDINHAADGGLYGELIRNRSFEDALTPEYWTTIYRTGASVTASLETTNLLNANQTKALKLNVTKATATARAGIYNSGFWGINIVEGHQYQLTFFAKCDTSFKGVITASLESLTGISYGETTISGLTTGWQKFSCTITPSGNNASGRLVLATNAPGIIWFDVVSLFPPTFKNRTNGCRPELAQLLADLHPKFMRFPGGCFVEGDSLSHRFQWKKTVGPIENRPGHWNLWGYRTSDGMGFHEFLQLAEDLGAKPLYVTQIGVSHTDFQPYTSLDGYIQDALDALEYANGSVSTTYGAMRAANGHPEPFNIEYLEIGNENNWGDNYANRFKLFQKAVKTKYPNIQCISNSTSSITEDIVDEHYYSSPDWFVSKYNLYDTYSRTGSKIYTGEYAVTSNCGQGNLSAAIGEAAFMCGMEKNSDVVVMNSYAPIFVNNNNRAWNPDMIVYNASDVYCTPSYYVQKLFANNIGTVNIPVKDSLNLKLNPIDATGNIGLGTWLTKADYSNVLVTNSLGNAVFSESFASSTNWTPGNGTWSLTNNIYSQTSTLEDCRSIAKTQITDSVYVYSLKARKTGGNEGFLVIFGYKDSNDFYWWNLGGWGNSKHAIEQCVSGTKTILTSVTGSITTNVWYDIRIEVSSSKIMCYLNNKLIHTQYPASSRILYTSASMDESTNKLFIKVVNPTSADVSSMVSLKGAAVTGINGDATVLTSAGASDENSFTNPGKIVPVSSGLDTTGNSLNYNFKAKSVTVLRLNVGNGNSVQPGKTVSRFSVYPNPATDKIFFKGPEQGNISVKIRNLTGQLIIDKQTTDGVFDVSALKKGAYLLTARQGENSFTAKVIKD
jgi:alpha-L-arabinofuranosidase